MRLSNRILIVCVLPLLLPAAAIAQPTGPGPGGPGPNGPGPGGPPAMDQPGRDMPKPPLPGERVEAELAYLKTALKITDAETQAWNKVADALRDRAKRKDAEIIAMRARTPDAAPPTLVDMLEHHQKEAAGEADEASKLLAAVKPLYAMLTPEQKETADHLPFFGPGPMGPHGPGMMPPMPPGGRP